MTRNSISIGHSSYLNEDYKQSDLVYQDALIDQFRVAESFWDTISKRILKMTLIWTPASNLVRLNKQSFTKTELNLMELMDKISLFLLIFSSIRIGTYAILVLISARINHLNEVKLDKINHMNIIITNFNQTTNKLQNIQPKMQQLLRRNYAKELLTVMMAPVIQPEELAYVGFLIIACALIFNGICYKYMLFKKVDQCETLTFIFNPQVCTLNNVDCIKHELEQVRNTCKRSFSQNITRLNFNSLWTDNIKKFSIQDNNLWTTNCDYYTNLLSVPIKKSDNQKMRMRKRKRGKQSKQDLLLESFKSNQKCLNELNNNYTLAWPLNRYPKTERLLVQSLIKIYIQTVLTSIIATAIIVSFSLPRKILEEKQIFKDGTYIYKQVLRPLSVFETLFSNLFLADAVWATFLGSCPLYLFSLISLDMKQFIDEIGKQFDDLTKVLAQFKANTIDRELSVEKSNFILANIDLRLIILFVRMKNLKKKLQPALKFGQVLLTVQTLYAIAAGISTSLLRTLSHKASFESMILTILTFFLLLNSTIPIVSAFSLHCQHALPKRMLTLMANLVDMNETYIKNINHELKEWTDENEKGKEKASKADFCIRSEKATVYFDSEIMSSSAINPFTMHIWRKSARNLDLLGDALGIKFFGRNIEGYSFMIEANVWIVSFLGLLWKHR